MKSLRAKLLLIGTVGSLLLSVVPQSSANSITSKRNHIAQLQRSAAQLDQQTSRDVLRANALQLKLQTYAISIHNVVSAAKRNQREIRADRKQLKQLNQSLHRTEHQLAVYRERLTEQFRVMYEGGSNEYIAVVLGATSFADLLDRVYTLTVIAQADRTLEQKVLILKSRLTTERHAENDVLTRVENRQVELDLLMRTDVALQRDRRRAFADVKQHIQDEQYRHGLLESQIQLTQAQVQELEAKTAQDQARVSTQSYVDQTRKTMVAANVPGMIGFAESFIGVPYVWGGTSPSGFDCSGFTQYVLQRYGISIPRTSEDQFGQGLPVAQSDLKPGDLVFFSTYAPGASHVGIYIGNGLMVNAEDRGVAIDGLFNSYWGSKYIGARQYTK